MMKTFNIGVVVTAILIIVGAGLLIAGFYVPPLGVIDSSILVAYGETLTFIGAVLGINYSAKFKEFLRQSNAQKD